MNDELQLELNELNALRGVFDSEEFKKYVLAPVQAELETLKNAYDCESLRELHTIKGKKQGLRIFLDIVENISTRIENKRLEASQGE